MTENYMRLATGDWRHKRAAMASRALPGANSQQRGATSGSVKRSAAARSV